jgi:hypothetical protein
VGVVLFVIVLLLLLLLLFVDVIVIVVVNDRQESCQASSRQAPKRTGGDGKFKKVQCRNVFPCLTDTAQGGE